MPDAPTFTIQQATALLPTLKEQLSLANDELDAIHIRMDAATQECEDAEEELSTVRATSGEVADLAPLRAARKRYEGAIDQLTTAKKEYLQTFEKWMNEITKDGVILRDIRSGLLDLSLIHI